MTWSASAWDAEPPHLGDLATMADPSWWIVYWRDRFVLTPNEPEDWTRSIGGSAFGPHGEVRWRVDGATVRAVALLRGERAGGTATRPGTVLEGLEEAAGDPVPWMLSGTYRAGSSRWLDGRFPRPFEYEVGSLDPQEGSRLQLEAVTLLDHGAPAFHALTRLTLALPHGPRGDR